MVNYFQGKNRMSKDNNSMLLQLAAAVDSVLLEMLKKTDYDVQLLSCLLVTRLKRLNADLDNIEAYNKLLKTVLDIKTGEPSAQEIMDNLEDAKAILDGISIRSKQ